MLLDLSAAFDTVDHDILLDRLKNWVGLSGSVLNWFESYLKNRDYFVSIGDYVSERKIMTWSSPRFNSGTSPVQHLHASIGSDYGKHNMAS